MKQKITITLSTEVIEAADEMAAKMGISRNKLISFFLEGSTNPKGMATRRGAK